MNAKQKKRVRDIIQKDAKVDGRYYQEGDFCVIGGLLHEAGVSTQKLKAMDNKNTSSIDQFEWALEILNKEFGIDQDLAVLLQQTNDDAGETEERREDLLRVLDRQKVRPS